MNLATIQRPTLLVDKAKVLRNVRRMSAKADDLGFRLKPHFKTHQSLAIGRWLREEDIEGITVSSLSMASYFADDGWEYITVAFPANPRELDLMNKLSEKAELTILISDADTFSLLKRDLSNRVRVLLEIDCGYGRSGFDSSATAEIESVARQIIDAGFVLEGLYCHSGNTYKVSGADAITKIHDHTVSELNRLQSELTMGADLALSLGDTPSCSVAENFNGIDSVRPGNFVFYDYMQSRIGSCTIDDIAIVLATPVVAVDRERKQAVLYGGGVHLSKDYVDGNGGRTYGRLSTLKSEGWESMDPESHLLSVSQEHGIASVSASDLPAIKVGDLIGVLPIHSCMTADLMGEYWTLEGERLDHMSGNKFSSHA